MIRFRRLLCLFSIVLSLSLTPGFAGSGKAEAARFSGAYLLKICGIDDDGGELVKGGHTACQAYISGVLDYHNVLQSLKIAPRVEICVPKEASIAELHRVVLRFLQNNTEHDSFVAAPAVTMALYEQFPCS